MDVAYRFIGGSGRSGTTLLFQVLSKHPDAFGILETQIFPIAIFQFIDGKIPTSRCMEVLDFCLSDKRKLSDALISIYMQLRPQIDALLFNSAVPEIDKVRGLSELVFARPAFLANKRTVVEKSPGIVRFAARMKRALPNAKFVNIHRDPRDVFSSMRTFSWGPKTVTHFCEEYVKGASESLRDCEAIGTKDYRVVSMEALLANPKPHVEALWQFFDLDTRPELVEEAVALISTKNANLSRWKTDLSAVDAETIERACRDVTDKLMRLTMLR
jgi:hypothetical protein